MTLDRTFVECSALGFQSTLTSVLAITCYVLWRRQRGDHFLTWSAAWFLYVLRLAAMSAFLVRRDMIWLFLHQVMTGLSALLLLAAAIQLSRGFTWRPRHTLAVPLVVGWAWLTIYGMHSMVIAGVTSTLLLASVTIWTGIVFWRAGSRLSSGATTVLTWAFVLWGIHHLDYPLLRGFGASVLYGVFVDVLFLFAIGIGLLFLVLGDERRRLASRTAELEQLTRLLLRAQEDERRRIARELHDEAGQVLTAAKIELDLEGHHEAGARVGHALAQVRELSNLLRPSALDDLGLVPALRALADDVSQRSRLQVDLDVTYSGRMSPDTEVVVYRVIQEALTNTVRHARATWVRASVAGHDQNLVLTVEDDGQGLGPGVSPNLGWLGMQERVTAVGGTLSIGVGARGVRLTASFPVEAAS
ncbi:MAG: sensor histidine kinase [Vicinamibacterales bacterium]